MAPRVLRSRAPLLQTRSDPRKWLEPNTSGRAQYTSAPNSKYRHRNARAARVQNNTPRVGG
eukprot:13514606-Alexandrium_andersonii.AAC.1